MEERKDNKGSASLEDILNYASNETQNEEDISKENEEVINIDSSEDSKSLFETDKEILNENNNEPELEEVVTPLEESPVETNDVEVPEPIQEIVEEPSIFENSQGLESNIDTASETVVEDPEIREEIHYKREQRQEPQSNGSYFGFEKRIMFYSILFIVPFVVAFFLVIKSLYINNAEYINYTEKSDLDYKVYLKENTFYDEPFLGKDMLYVASLIDHIDIDFLYNFEISEKTDLNLDYTINGVLTITDTDGKKTYLTKTYDLLPKKSINMASQDQTITEKIIIDYEEYNKLANSFKATYGVDTSSKLSIYLNVDKISGDNKIQSVTNDNNMLIEIPLSQRSVSISMDYKNINNNSNLVKKKSISIGNIVLLLIAAGVFVISIFFLLKLLKLVGILNENKTAHDKYINKLMRQYDRLIVEHFTCPELQKYNVIKIKDFNELLDMRDNLKTPILYYNVQKHQKSYFYIQNFKDLYLLIVKDVDLENEKKK